MNAFMTFPWKFWDAVGPVVNGMLRNWQAVSIAVAAFQASPPAARYILDLASSIKAVWN